MITPDPGSRPIRVAAVGLDHAHAFGQIEGLLNQGCQLVGFSSDDPAAAVALTARRRWPDVMWVEDSMSVLHDPSIDVIVTAAVPDRRSAIAIEALTNGKDVIVDKPGCITLDQLDEIEKAVTQSGRFWSVTFSERFGVRCAIKAGQLVREGRIGRVVQTLGLGPHREGDRAHLAGGQGRPEWFYDRRADWRHPHRYRQPPDRPVHVVHRRRGGRGRLEHRRQLHPSRVAENAGFRRGDVEKRRCPWLRPGRLVHPASLPTWGDGRLVILGTEGYIELRKYVDLAGRPGRDHLFVADDAGTEYIDCSDVELSYYPDLVHDVINRTETACPQKHTFEVMRLAIRAQQSATMLGFAK